MCRLDHYISDMLRDSIECVIAVNGDTLWKCAYTGLLFPCQTIFHSWMCQRDETLYKWVTSVTMGKSNGILLRVPNASLQRCSEVYLQARRPGVPACWLRSTTPCHLQMRRNTTYIHRLAVSPSLSNRPGGDFWSGEDFRSNAALFPHHCGQTCYIS